MEWRGPQPVGIHSRGFGGCPVVNRCSAAVSVSYACMGVEASRHRNLADVLEKMALDMSTLWAGESDKWNGHPHYRSVAVGHRSLRRRAIYSPLNPRVR